MRTGLTELVHKFRAISVARRRLLLVFCSLLGLLLFALNQRMEVPSVSKIQPAENFPTALQTDTGYLPDDDKQQNLPAILNELAESRAVSGGIGAAVPDSRTPLIAHTAELAVATKEFARSRLSLEEIVERHRGYAARLRMAGRRTGSVLSATLRIPSPELASTISELKSLGEVEQEEQAADEITQQRADLEARLNNAQGTLRRLQELLKKQTYPDGNVRELQRQIAAASGDVNRLEAERQASEHRVVFANVQFSLREEITSPQESFSAQLHGAAATGFNEAAASLSAILLFLIGRGPLVLLWLAILFVPARFVWRRWPISAAPAITPAAQG